MKKIYLLILLLKTTIQFAANNNALPNFQVASDLDCLINFEHKISKKEQKKIREILIEIALKTDSRETIYASFSTVFPKLKLNQNSLEKDCILNRLYENKATLLACINPVSKELKPINAPSLSENQKQVLLSLMQLRTFFVLKYAYFDEKKEIFNAQWQQAISSVFVSKDIEENNAIRLILNALEDPHVHYKSNKNNVDKPYILKGEMWYVFPFQFKVINNEIFVSKKQDSKGKLINNNPQIKHGLKILEINGLSSKKWLDSIERKDGPFFQDRNYMLSNMLQLYYLYEKPTTFKFRNTDATTFELTIERIPLSLTDFQLIFQSATSEKTIANAKRPHFHYINYEKQSNKLLTEFFKSVSSKDTVVFDFRGYPTQQVTDATVLLFGTEEKKVSYSLLLNPRTGCYDVHEEISVFSTKNTPLKKEIKEKQLVLYGIIDNGTGSYVETVVMTYKTYLPDFQLIGEPSAGAWGTMEYEPIGDNGDVSYPYHQFYFYEKKFLNDQNLIKPDIPLTSEGIERFINFGQLK
jgi:hypothetical protein